jgi:hypothetical protein
LGTGQMLVGDRSDVGCWAIRLGTCQMLCQPAAGVPFGFAAYPAGSTLRGNEKQLINASTVGALNALTSDLSPIVVVPYRGRVLYHRGCSDARIRFRHLTCPLCLVIVLVLVVVLVLEWRRAAKEVAGQTSFTFFAQIRAVHTGDG